MLARAPHLQASEAPKRRPYPKVQPKFQNPERPFETWAGRGRQPHWVIELIEAGKNLDDFRIGEARELVPAWPVRFRDEKPPDVSRAAAETLFETRTKSKLSA